MRAVSSLKGHWPSFSWGLCGLYGRAHHRANALSPCGEVPQTSSRTLLEEFSGRPGGRRRPSGVCTHGVPASLPLAPSARPRRARGAAAGGRRVPPAPTTGLSKLPGSVNRHFALRILCRPMSRCRFALNTLSPAKQWLGARNRAQGMRNRRGVGGVVGKAGGTKRQDWCRTSAAARGWVRSSGLRRPPRGRDFRDGKQQPYRRRL